MPEFSQHELLSSLQLFLHTMLSFVNVFRPLSTTAESAIALWLGEQQVREAQFVVPEWLMDMHAPS